METDNIEQSGRHEGNKDSENRVKVISVSDYVSFVKELFLKNQWPMGIFIVLLVIVLLTGEKLYQDNWQFMFIGFLFGVWFFSVPKNWKKIIFTHYRDELASLLRAEGRKIQAKLTLNTNFSTDPFHNVIEMGAIATRWLYILHNDKDNLQEYFSEEEYQLFSKLDFLTIYRFRHYYIIIENLIEKDADNVMGLTFASLGADQARIFSFLSKLCTPKVQENLRDEPMVPIFTVNKLGYEYLGEVFELFNDKFINIQFLKKEINSLKKEGILSKEVYED